MSTILSNTNLIGRVNIRGISALINPENWKNWNNTVKSNTLMPVSSSGQLITSAELPAEESWHSWNNTAKSNTLIPAVTNAIEIQ